MSLSKHKVATAAVVTVVLVSVLAMAGTSAAVKTTVTGPDEVAHPDSITLTSTVEIQDDERVPIDNFTITIRPSGDADREVDITFAPDGTIVDVDPDRGVVGNGEIRIGLLERTTEVRLSGANATHSYGSLHGYDERTDEFQDFGYGYGFGYGDDQPTFTYEIELDTRAFKHGDYELFLSINADDETKLFQSNVHAFEVQLPTERQPGPPDDRPNTGDDDRRNGPDNRNDRDERSNGPDDRSNGPDNRNDRDDRSKGPEDRGPKKSITGVDFGVNELGGADSLSFENAPLAGHR